MRTALWALAASIAFTSGAFAQDVIEWSSERRLTKADFRGRVPAGAGNASMSWLNIDLSWGCEVGELVASARATFDPSQSWWRTDSANIWKTGRRSIVQRDAQLLQHEQTHFDLTELAVRRIRKRLDELKDACDEPEDMDKVRHDIAKIDGELQEEQRRYDRETAYGTNAIVQSRWTERVKRLLR